MPPEPPGTDLSGLPRASCSRVGFIAASITTVVLLAAQAFHLPSPLKDAVTGEYLQGYSLHIPLGHLLTTPLSASADMITLNSARQDRILIWWILAAYGLCRFWSWRGKRPRWRRETAGLALYLACVAAWLAWAILLPRPAISFNAGDPDDLVIDFHSHTSYSWDARRSFTPAANMAWHQMLGFDATFITDHNTTAGALEGKALSRAAWSDWLRRGDGAPGGPSGPTPFRALEGEEVSLQDTHVGVLGNRVPIDNTLYNKNLEGVFRFLREARRYGGTPVMNLPEFWLHHPRIRWDEFVLNGAGGFEIANAVPIAMDFPADLRREVVALCRERGLFYYGVTDNHGWGSASAVWNVMRIPGQKAMDPDALQDEVVAALRTQGPRAVRVIERVKQPPLAAPWILADPVLGAWTLARTFRTAQTWACLVWIWGAVLIKKFFLPSTP